MPLEMSDHFDGRRFRNPSGSAGQPFSAVPRMLLEPRTPWPARVDEPPRRPPGLDGSGAVVTFIWGGFMLTAGGARIFFAGDTAYAAFFRELRQRFGPIDLALLPIGAYEPRWFMQSVHMNPAEAVQAHLDLEASESLGMHFGTFQMTTEGIDEPLRALEDACRANSIPPSRFRTLGFGESLRLGYRDR
jgi:L-ascorbate metabolism protein UlaG (beta-lactamase superfamily)